MILMAACLAQLKPSMAVMHFFCSALHKDAPSPRSLSLLNNMLQRKDALYGVPFVKILYLTDLTQKLLSLHILSYLCADNYLCAHLAISAHI